MRVIGGPSGPTFRGPTVADVDFTLTSAANDVFVSEGTTSSTTYKDEVLTRHTTPSVDRGARISVTGPIGVLPADVILSVAAESAGIGSIAGNVVARLANGTVKVNAVSPLLTKQIAVAVTRTGSTTDVFASWAVGSLAGHMSDQSTSRLVGKTPAGAIPLFSTRDDAAGVYVRNPGSWLADVDMTCLAVAAKFPTLNMWPGWGPYKGGILVTRKHVLLCAHWGAGNVDGNAFVRFLGSDGVLVERTIVAFTPTSGTDGGIGLGGTDLLIGTLDSDLPETVTPASVMPANWASYLPRAGRTAGGVYAKRFVPMFGVTHAGNDWKQASVRGITLTLNGLYDIASGLETWYRPAIMHDSGHPAFAMVNGAPVLLTVWTFGNGGSGSDISSNIAAIEAVTGEGYQLTQCDLSGFPTFA